MGTSTSQRSPKTEEWEYVREAYREGVTDPVEISRRVTAALTPATRQMMSGAGPATCLEALLAGVRGVADPSVPPPFGDAASAIDGVSALRMDAERRLALGGHASPYSAIALDALGACALRTMPALSEARDLAALQRAPLTAITTPLSDTPLHQISGSFFAEDLGRCFRYFVARDISDFVGTQSFATVNDASRLVEDVGRYLYDTSVRVPLADYEDRLRESVHERDAAVRNRQVQDVFSAAVEGSLAQVSGE